MQPGFEFIFELNGKLDPAVPIGDTPHGKRRVVPITGGTFEGPAIRGTILPGGADWQVERGDGVNELEALYLLRSDDGVVIQVRNRGLRHGSPDVMRRLAAGETVDPGDYYFRSTPSFAAPSGKYEWLNRSIHVCTGARYGGAIRLWFYRVT